MRIKNFLFFIINDLIKMRLIMRAIEKFNEEVKNRGEELGNDFKKIKEAWRAHQEFLRKFPFRENPEEVDNLTPIRLYNPGSYDSFFYYLEHKLKALGHISVPSDAPWRNAKENLDLFKSLLKTAVDESKSVAEKIDVKWEQIPRWGGDKHFAKKIIFCYFPEKGIPIFKTEHMEHFVEVLGLAPEKEKISNQKFNKSYDSLTLGEKYEVLTDLLLRAKAKTDLKDKDNAVFARALYKIFPPAESIVPSKILTPLSAVKMLFSPVNELGVVALFSMYHRELGFPYVIKIQPQFPDALVIDSESRVRKIEFELFASTFKAHGHDPKECDYIVCWEDDIPSDDDLRTKLKIIALKEKLGFMKEEE